MPFSEYYPVRKKRMFRLNGSSLDKGRTKVGEKALTWHHSKVLYA